MTDHEKSIEIKRQAYSAEMNGHIPCQRCGRRGDDVLIVTQWHKRLWNHTIQDLVLCAECRNDLAVALKGGQK